MSVWSESFVAGEDLSDKQFYAVKIDPAVDGQVVIADSDTVGIGILQNNPKAGQEANVMILGMTKAIASAAHANGAEVASNSSGKLKSAQTGDLILGIANTTVSVLLTVFSSF